MSTTTAETYRLAFPDHKNPPYTHVSYGLPFHESCAKHISGSLDRKRALEKALGSHHVATWTGIRPHTPWEDLIPIINDMREKQADVLITLGGGSLTDGAKIIIYALANNVRTMDDIDKILTLSKEDKANGFLRDRSNGNVSTIPMVFIPTTLSAGEYSNAGGATNSTTHQKDIFTNPKMFASLVILDPELCLTTPEWVWLSTGVRAIDHCVEGYCSLQCPEEVQEAAAKSLKLLIPGLLKTKHDPSDLKARLDCQKAANYILVMLLYLPKLLLVGASHGIGHQLGPLGVGHGQTSCILLPAVLEYNKPVNKEKQQKIADIIWDSDPEVTALLREAGLQRQKCGAGEMLDLIFRALGMPRTLREVGVGRDKFDKLAENSLRDQCCVVNPIPLTEKAQVLEILEMVVG